MLTRKMLRQVVSSGRLSIVCKSKTGLERIPLYTFLFWRLGDKTVRRIISLPQDHVVRRFVYGVRKLPFVLRFWRKIFKRPSPFAVQPRRTGEGSGPPGDGSQVALTPNHANPVAADAEQSHLDLAFFRELLRRAQIMAKHAKPAISRRVILVNAGLTAGGAERQIVNTLLGLRTKNLESVAFLGEYLHSEEGLDFHLPKLQGQHIEASEPKRRFTLEEHGLASVSPDVAEMLAALPPRTIEEIMNLAEEFRLRRPEVVHAWQDGSSVKCGIAATIASAPRIILSSRNVNPTHFDYFLDFMKPAYLAFSELRNVTLVNNSEAGAADYCAWLGLARGHFKVIRNGVDLSGLRRVDPMRAAAYRAEVGLPLDAVVVGSVFRFWPEKRPLLWLQTASIVHEALPDVHFVIVGDGPLRTQMEKFIKHAGFVDRVHLPGVNSNVAVPLSIMDLFLLTSEFEGTPNVVLEAQWLGVPVVATDSGGTRETVLEGQSGWIASDADPETLAHLVIEKLTNREALQAASASAPQFVAKYYGLTRMIDETLQLYGYA
jgi:glycosyltransferase involved in cell wall biosynthesis